MDGLFVSYLINPANKFGNIFFFILSLLLQATDRIPYT